MTANENTGMDLMSATHQRHIYIYACSNVRVVVYNLTKKQRTLHVVWILCPYYGDHEGEPEEAYVGTAKELQGSIVLRVRIPNELCKKDVQRSCAD